MKVLFKNLYFLCLLGIQLGQVSFVFCIDDTEGDRDNTYTFNSEKGDIYDDKEQRAIISKKIETNSTQNSLDQERDKRLKQDTLNSSFRNGASLHIETTHEPRTIDSNVKKRDKDFKHIKNDANALEQALDNDSKPDKTTLKIDIIDKKIDRSLKKVVIPSLYR